MAGALSRNKSIGRCGQSDDTPRRKRQKGNFSRVTGAHLPFVIGESRRVFRVLFRDEGAAMPRRCSRRVAPRDDSSCLRESMGSRLPLPLIPVSFDSPSVENGALFNART